MPGEVGNIRNDIFLERAIVGERLRLAMGLPCRSAAEHAPLSDGIEAATRAGDLLHAAADQRDQVRVPRLHGERGHGHGRLSGLSWRIRALRYVPRAQYRSTAPTAVLLSIRRSASSAAAAWMSVPYHAIIQSGAPVRGSLRHGCHPHRLKTAEPISITTSAFPAASAL